jgi:hypothetical protein
MNRARGRPPTGCPKWNADKQVWEARILLPSGGRRPVPMPGIPEHDEDRAKALAAVIALRAQDGGYVAAAASETVNEWFDRYYNLERPDQRFLPVPARMTALGVELGWWHLVGPELSQDLHDLVERDPGRLGELQELLS